MKYKNGVHTPDAIQNTETKVCRHCGVDQPIDQYQVTRYLTLASWCRTCKNKAQLISFYKRKHRDKQLDQAVS